MTEINRRILIVDDSSAIHEDFRKILAGGAGCGQAGARSQSSSRSAFLGGRTGPGAVTGDSTDTPSTELPHFELTSAHQGEEALALLQESLDEERPFAMAFVDVRMPPGWDGLKTVEELWKADDRLQVVLCTAYSDYGWAETIDRLTRSDRLLILKKPFDPVEICQLAASLTSKWTLARSERQLIGELEAAEQEARAYASSLETVNRALESSKAAAEGHAATMGEFLLRLSSELQGGLTSALAPLIEGASLDGEACTHLDQSLTVATRLLGSLDELHDLCLHETGKLSCTPEACSPRQLVEELVCELSPVAEAVGVCLDVKLDDDLPPAIQTDPLRLTQVLRQLLRNALHHAQASSIRLTVRSLLTDDWKRPRVRFEVEDDGIGLSPEHHASIFTPFFRVEDGTGMSGTGVGLSLARRLAGALGGELSMESAPGAGSTFRLDLDRGRVAEGELSGR